jgi:hypothetical protein
MEVTGSTTTTPTMGGTDVHAVVVSRNSRLSASEPNEVVYENLK